MQARIAPHGFNDRIGVLSGTQEQTRVEAVPETPLVRLRGVSKRYGPVTAVREQNLDIQRGDFLAILGPSGCGKTTLLRIIGGFVALDIDRKSVV